MWSLRVCIVCVATWVHLVASFPTGVPQSSCVDMLPMGPAHNNGIAQDSEIPYDFELDRSSIQNTEKVEFTIKQKPNGPEFLGFMVQARSGSSTTPLGTFQPTDDNVLIIACDNKLDTASHNNPDPKSVVSMLWTPPSEFKGKVDFYVTIVQKKETFWAHENVASLSVE